MEQIDFKTNQQFSRPKYEVADVFRDNTHKLNGINYPQWLVVNSIIACRTKRMGGHSIYCPKCGFNQISYNSCRNRHCPKCQTIKKLKWIDERLKELLPINYFHIVFTIPNILNYLVLQNKQELYNILFTSVKETLTQAALNPKNLGAKIGFVAVLHTWGQNLLEHPHIHCVVTGGGLSKDKKNWIKSNNNYFISVKLLGKLFKGKYLFYLKNLYKEGKLSFHGKLKKIQENDKFMKLLTECYEKDWVVYSKKPFSNPKTVYQYLGRYTHRIAISNHRIVNITKEEVKFFWKDYKNGNVKKIMTLSIDEFMRRFLLHVLPKGLKRIRFYGILTNRYKKQNLKIIKNLLNVNVEEEAKRIFNDSIIMDYRKYSPLSKCPKCNNKDIIIEDIPVEKIVKSYFNTS